MSICLFPIRYGAVACDIKAYHTTEARFYAGQNIHFRFWVTFTPNRICYFLGQDQFLLYLMVPWMTLTSSLVDIRVFGCILWVSCGSGPLFTKLARVLSYDLVNSRRSGRYASKFPIALILASHLDRTLYRCLFNFTFFLFPKDFMGPCVNTS